MACSGDPAPSQPLVSTHSEGVSATTAPLVLPVGRDHVQVEQEHIEQAPLITKESLCAPLEKELFSCQLMQEQARLPVAVALCWCEQCRAFDLDTSEDEAQMPDSEGAVLYRKGAPPFTREVGWAEETELGFELKTRDGQKQTLYTIEHRGDAVVVESLSGPLSCARESIRALSPKLPGAV